MSIQKSLAVAAIGTERLITAPFLIQSVRVDNPSGLWLYVREATTPYVPPNTLSWIQILTPPVSGVHITYVSSPGAGTPSAATGSPISVTVYEIVQPSSNGIAYTQATVTDIAVLAAQLALIQAQLNPINNPPVNISITVTNVATLLRTVASTVEALAFHNNDTTDTVFIGPSTVTAAGANRGYPLVPGGDFTVDLGFGISYYGIVAAGTADVSVQYAAIT